MTTEMQTVLEFWFGPGDDDLESIRSQSDLWWNAEPVVDAQARSVSLNRQLVAEVSAPLRRQFENYLGYALEHQQLIQCFGRFPHRNAALGRANTDEERDYLGLSLV